MKFQNIFEKEGFYMAAGLPKDTFFFISDEGLYELHRPADNPENSVLKKYILSAKDFKRECKKVDFMDLPKNVKLGWLLDTNPFKFNMSFYLNEQGYTRFKDITSIDVFKVSEREYNVIFNTTRPGLLIGKAGALINGLQQELIRLENLTHLDFHINEVAPAIEPPAVYDYF